MEAVSRGAAENGGHVIGVTCDQIEAWRPVAPNQWMHEERRFETLLQRMSALINNCDAAMALPGGPGTLTEISLMWNLLLTKVLPLCPLILIGAGWKATFTTFFEKHSAYIPEDQRSLVSFTKDVISAYDELDSQ